MTKEQNLFLNKIKTDNKREYNTAADNLLKYYGRKNTETISEISDIAKMIVEKGAVEEESMSWIKPNMAVLDMSSQQIIDLLYDKVFSLDDDDCSAIQELELQKMEDSGYYNDDGTDIEIITIPYEEKIKKSTKIPVFIKSDNMFKTEIERYLKSISKNYQENQQYIIKNVSIGLNLLVRNYRRFLCESNYYIESVAQQMAFEFADKIINDFCEKNNVSRDTIIDDSLFYPFSMQLEVKNNYTVEEVHRLMPYMYKNERFLVDDTEDKKPETVFEIKIDDLLSQILGIRKYQYKLLHKSINAPSREFYEYTNKVEAYNATYNSWFDTYVLPYIHIKSSAEKNSNELLCFLLNTGAEVIYGNAEDIKPNYEYAEKLKILQELERKRIREQLNYGIKEVEVCGQNIKIPYRLWGFVPEIFVPEETLTFDLKVPYYTWELREDLTKEETKEYESLLLEKAKLTYRLRKERDNYFKVLQAEKRVKEQQQKEELSAYNRTHNKTLAQLNMESDNREIERFGHILTQNERKMICDADTKDILDEIKLKKAEIARLQKIVDETNELSEAEINKSVIRILFQQDSIPYRNIKPYSVKVQKLLYDEQLQYASLYQELSDIFLQDDEENLDEELDEENID